MENNMAIIIRIKLVDLPNSSKTLLTSYLDPIKVIDSDGSPRLPRYWLGLSVLLHLSRDDEAAINNAEDKTGRLIQLWCQKDLSATVLHLFTALEKIDRYDVRDDLIGDLLDHINNDTLPAEILGYLYPDCDVYIFYVKADKEVVDALDKELKYHCKTVATIEVSNVRAGQHVPQMNLVGRRCRSVVLLVSRHFIEAGADAFITDCLPAPTHDDMSPKVLPIRCNVEFSSLSQQLQSIHMLNYDSTLLNFWEKLAQWLKYPVDPICQRCNPVSVAVANTSESSSASLLQPAASPCVSDGGTTQHSPRLCLLDFFSWFHREQRPRNDEMELS